MASKGASRWADSEEDAALEAKLRREKEEKKKRLKAEKARKEAEQQARLAQQQRPQQQQQQGAQQQRDEAGDGRPSKRRKLTPEAEGGGGAGEGGRRKEEEEQEENNKLLRFTRGVLGDGCRSVELFDKLNDIEEGAYGWVSRAREAATGRVVALKRLKIDAKDRGGLPVTGLREIQLLRDCDHANVVRLHEVVVGEDTSRIENIFLVLEFLEHDLKSILEDMPEPFLASEVKALLHQLAAGVAYLHDNWILHRDLKTSNLLLNNRGRLKIADFGMARYCGDPPPPDLTRLVVTLWYRAPELLLGEARYGRAVDMWSVGCVFGELLAREPLLQGRNEVDELALIFELCGLPTEESWPGFRRLPNARSLRLPSSSSAPQKSGPALIRARFPLLTSAGSALLSSLLSLDPAARPSARDVLAHDYFRQDPRAKPEAMFPTFPSRAGQERRRRRETPDAPARAPRGEAGGPQPLGAVDFSGIFSGREREERGAGFSLRMV